ncbi:DNA-binding transcriptional activator BglJ, partial [Kluyvera ascorbata]|uniref:DNA-binding transcriptional activator BglJ n=1 Tax=Kluyvera ascorbata TaxID=51288 RepID=UPI0035CD2115
STLKSPSYTKSVSWQHYRLRHLLMSSHRQHIIFHFFRTITEFKQAAEQNRFDAVMCCLSGTRELRIEGLQAMGDIAQNYPAMKRLILADDNEEASLIQLLSPTYMHGILSKSDTLSELQQRILAVLMEKEESSDDIELHFSIRRNHVLSPTENLILRYMTYGYSLMDISQQLGRNIKTIRAHKFNAMSKLGVNSDIELLSAADLLVSLHDINTAVTPSAC